MGNYRDSTHGHDLNFSLSALDVNADSSRKLPQVEEYNTANTDDVTDDSDDTIEEKQVQRSTSLPVPLIEDTCSESSNKDSTTISFGKVEIREYKLILSDNPAAGAGPPIGIGNEFVTKDPINVEDIPLERKDDKIHPNEKLYLKPHDRLAMVRKNGYSDKEICECIVEVREAQRIRTKHAIANLTDEEKAEARNEMKRKMKKKFLRSKEQKDRDQRSKKFFNASKDYRYTGFRKTI